MEPWTGVFGAALLWLDREEDLAPRVLAMADRRKWTEVQVAEVQIRGRRWKVALVLGFLRHLFEVQMIGFIRNLEFIPLKIGCQESF